MIRGTAWRGKLLSTSKKASAIRQINAAVMHFHKGELDCAITLAAAAEGCLPSTDEPHLFKSLRRYPEAKDLDFNLVVNWLKHSSVDPEHIDISEFEATIVVARAITKYIAVYHESTPRFENFLQWGHQAGHLPASLL